MGLEQGVEMCSLGGTPTTPWVLGLCGVEPQKSGFVSNVPKVVG